MRLRILCVRFSFHCCASSSLQCIIFLWPGGIYIKFQFQEVSRCATIITYIFTFIKRVTSVISLFSPGLFLLFIHHFKLICKYFSFANRFSPFIAYLLVAASDFWDLEVNKTLNTAKCSWSNVILYKCI